jgi:hypothetical protein
MLTSDGVCPSAEEAMSTLKMLKPILVIILLIFIRPPSAGVPAIWASGPLYHSP